MNLPDNAHSLVKNLITFFSYCLLILSLAACNQIPYGNNKKAGKYYNVRGFRMYCETYGNGKPLLMIPGNEGSISTFKDIIPYFSEKYKVIVADGRAQGKSIDDKDSLSFEMMADDYATLLDEMHVDSAFVIGWSDGGINALLMAIRHPDKVKRLAASGPNLWPDSSAIDPQIWKSEKKKYAQLKNADKKTEKEKEDWKAFLLDWTQPHISTASLHKIKCPTLIIGGDHDMIRMKHLLLIYKNIPQPNLWIVKHSGHATLFEHRIRFEHHINDFFTSDFRENYNY